MAELWRLEWSTGQQAWHLEPAYLPRHRLAGWQIVALGAPEDMERIMASMTEEERRANTLELMAYIDRTLSKEYERLEARRAGATMKNDFSGRRADVVR